MRYLAWEIWAKWLWLQYLQLKAVSCPCAESVKLGCPSLQVPLSALPWMCVFAVTLSGSPVWFGFVSRGALGLGVVHSRPQRSGPTPVAPALAKTSLHITPVLRDGGHRAGLTCLLCPAARTVGRLGGGQTERKPLYAGSLASISRNCRKPCKGFPWWLEVGQGVHLEACFVISCLRTWKISQSFYKF